MSFGLSVEGTKNTEQQKVEDKQNVAFTSDLRY